MVRALRAALILLAITAGTAQAQPPRLRPAPRPGARAAPAAASDRAPRYKGIWEPVNYGEDIALNDVYFVTPDEGWVSSDNGVLLHTQDAGATWEVVLGDPAGRARPIRDLRFVDEVTGFAVQSTGIGDHSLLHTTDGRRWTVSGAVPQHRGDYRFFTGSVGVASQGNEIDRTTDAGRTWKKVFDCAMRVEVQGLTRAVRCEVAAFAFPSATVGYAIGNASEAPGLFVFRTDDQGATWTGWFVGSEESGREGHIFFTTETTGFACIGGHMVGTTDGGKTWTGIPGGEFPAKPSIAFADPEVAWTFRYSSMSYTVDGGARWVNRDVRLPASVLAVSLPRRDRGYAVGAHGMIYRYRVVPVETVVEKAIDAPAMPVFANALDDRVAELGQQIGALDSTAQATFLSQASDAGAGAGAAASGAVPSSCCSRRWAASCPTLSASTRT
jgi:photosystem II stability/assembly factor-like uncharacterized protein